MSDKIRTDDVLEILRRSPATSYELSLLLKVSHSFTSSRLSRLRRDGKVEQIEEHGKAHPGSHAKARRWRVCGG